MVLLLFYMSNKLVTKNNSSFISLFYQKRAQGPLLPACINLYAKHKNGLLPPYGLEYFITDPHWSP